MKQRCSLPAGLFEQLLAGMIKLSQAAEAGAYQPVLSRTYAFFTLGRYKVRKAQNDT